MTTNIPAPAMQEAIDILKRLRGDLQAHLINGPTMLCTDGKALNNADDEVLRALKLLVPLSKLRAPVADERAAFNKWAESLGYELGTPTVGLMLAGWNARAALASAPVVGEAVTDDMILHCWNAHVENPDDAWMTDDDKVSFGRALLARYAAPQASEAVRDAVLEEAAKVAECTVAGDDSPDNPYRGGTAKQAAARIRALKSQSAALSEPKCPQCALPLRQECNCDEGYAARAALSAQPGAQKEK